MPDLKCPRCRLLSPPEAQRCDCGWDFTTHRTEASHLTEAQREAGPVTMVGGHAAATMTQRLVNHLVDGVVIAVLMAPWALRAPAPDSERGGVLLLLYAIGFVYFLLCEGLTARTLGKVVTGTKVIRADGRPIGWDDAFARSACRYVPFEALSIFFGGLWHDRWTRTAVVLAQDGDV